MNNSNNISFLHFLTFMLCVAWSTAGVLLMGPNDNAFSEETKSQRLFRYVVYGPFAWLIIVVTYFHAAIYKALGK